MLKLVLGIQHAMGKRNGKLIDDVCVVHLVCNALHCRSLCPFCRPIFACTLSLIVACPLPMPYVNVIVDNAILELYGYSAGTIPAELKRSKKSRSMSAGRRKVRRQPKEPRWHVEFSMILEHRWLCKWKFGKHQSDENCRSAAL